MDYEEIYSLLKKGEILKVEEAVKSLKVSDKKICILVKIIEIFHNEVSADIERTVFDYSVDIDELAAHYTRTKLMLRRIEFDMPQRYIDEFFEYCDVNDVSYCMLLSMITANIAKQNQEKVSRKLAGLYIEKKGIKSIEAQGFLDFHKLFWEEIR